MRIALALAVASTFVASVALADAPRPAPKAREPGALVLLIDRSGSMQGPKIEAVKTAAKAAISAMHPDDMVAIVAFDSEASIYVQPTKAKDRIQIGKGIDAIATGGGTNIFPALRESKKIMESLKAVKKHVIVLSDGEAPYDGISDLVKEMHEDKVTISTVAVPGADEVLLEQISKDGAGRMYKVSDLKTLSQVYVKELGEAKLALK